MEINLIDSFNSITNIDKSSIVKLCDTLGLSLEFITFYIVGKKEIQELNIKYLKHDFSTDILTFDLRDEISNEAEIYICYPIAEENAIRYKTSTEMEINRLIIHGILHISGFNDKEEIEKREMKKFENHFLKMFVSRENK